MEHPARVSTQTIISIRDKEYLVDSIVDIILPDVGLSNNFKYGDWCLASVVNWPHESFNGNLLQAKLDLINRHDDVWTADFLEGETLFSRFLLETKYLQLLFCVQKSISSRRWRNLNRQ